MKDSETVEAPTPTIKKMMSENEAEYSVLGKIGKGAYGLV